MNTPDDIDALAGEYVLGTLDAAERAEVAARRLREPVLDAAISAWETRLAPLSEPVEPMAPSHDLYARIERRVFAVQSEDREANKVFDLERRVKRWRGVAQIMTALAASLAIAIGLRETVWRPETQRYVAVFAKDDIAPAFYLTIDLKTRELTLRPVGAEKQLGKTYQMWIASDQLGPQPQSLGLVEDDLSPTRKSLTQFDPALLQRATFGVSLEPAGGSPTGRPTAPALHAKLLPATN